MSLQKQQRFVLDASLTISWCFEKEQTAATEAILDSFAAGHSALVPALWFWEVNNILLLAERHKRLTVSQRHQEIARLQKFTIEVDEDAHRRVWSDTANLARKYQLSVYDAVYLELALRQDLALGSLDHDLRKAAIKAGIKCLPERI